VDDERAVRGGVVRLLQRRGYETAEAPDAETALSILGREPRRFGLVITDDRMPGMSGYELVAVIARIHPHLRIVLMSGYTDAAEPVDA
jgi:DNA-binding NtrC family response regulator